MSRRMTAAIAACCVAVGALAGDKKKLDYSPETGPEPRTVEAAPPTIQSPQFHEGPQPQYFLADPPFPLKRETAYQEDAAGLCIPRDLPARMTIKIYSVGDLVVPIPAAGDDINKTAKTLESELIKKLTGTVEPKCWAASGGSCTVEYFPLGMALVINAPPSVHDAIGKYFDGLRRMQDTQCSVEIKLVTVTDAGLERLGLAHDFLPKAGELRTKVKFLTSDDVARIDLRAADPIMLTMPKLTVLNGQEGCMNVGEVQHFLTGVNVQTVNGSLVLTPKNEPRELGINAKVRPEVSADGRFIKIAMNVQAHDLVVKPVALVPLTIPVNPVHADDKKCSPVPFTQFLQDPRIVTRTVDETVTLPDGGTVVFYGGPATTEETVPEPSLLFADIPVLSEMFAHKATRKETNHLLVFATARAIRPDGDEFIQCAGGTGKLPKLMAEYGRACREGNVEEARRLALECLVIDPTCFSKK
jgi:hypothetical protein